MLAGCGDDGGSVTSSVGSCKAFNSAPPTVRRSVVSRRFRRAEPDAPPAALARAESDVTSFCRVDPDASLAEAVAAAADASPTPTVAATPGPDTIAMVANEKISEGEFRHWAAIARASDGKGGSSQSAIRNQVMQLLISFRWIRGEADARGIDVTADEVQRSFDKQRAESFPRDADYEKFLKTSGQTPEDIRHRVELDLLSNRIRERVAGGGDKQKALDRFVKDFTRRWQARTRCRPAYKTSDCGGTL